MKGKKKIIKDEKNIKLKDMFYGCLNLKIDGIKIEDDKLSDWTFELYFYGNKI